MKKLFSVLIISLLMANISVFAEVYIDDCSSFGAKVVYKANAVLQDTGSTVLYMDTKFIRRADGAATGYVIFDISGMDHIQLAWYGRNAADAITYFVSSEDDYSLAAAYTQITPIKTHLLSTTTPSDYKRYTDLLKPLSTGNKYLKAVMAGGTLTDQYPSPKIGEVTVYSGESLIDEFENSTMVYDKSTNANIINSVSGIEDLGLIGRAASWNGSDTEYVRLGVLPGDTVRLTYYRKMNSYDYEPVIGLNKKSTAQGTTNNINLKFEDFIVERITVGDWQKVACTISRDIIGSDAIKLAFKFPVDGKNNVSSMFLGKFERIAMPKLTEVKIFNEKITDFNSEINSYEKEYDINIQNVTESDITAAPLDKADSIVVTSESISKYEKKFIITVSSSNDSLVNKSNEYTFILRSYGLIFDAVNFEHTNPFSAPGKNKCTIDMFSSNESGNFTVFMFIYDKDGILQGCSFDKVTSFTGNTTIDFDYNMPANCSGGSIKLCIWASEDNIAPLISNSYDINDIVN